MRSAFSLSGGASVSASTVLQCGGYCAVASQQSVEEPGEEPDPGADGSACDQARGSGECSNYQARYQRIEIREVPAEAGRRPVELLSSEALMAHGQEDAVEDTDREQREESVRHRRPQYDSDPDEERHEDEGNVDEGAGCDDVEVVEDNARRGEQGKGDDRPQRQSEAPRRSWRTWRTLGWKGGWVPVEGSM